jgi:hypothetical protein
MSPSGARTSTTYGTHPNTLGSVPLTSPTSMAPTATRTAPTVPRQLVVLVGPTRCHVTQWDRHTHRPGHAPPPGALPSTSVHPEVPQEHGTTTVVRSPRRRQPPRRPVGHPSRNTFQSPRTASVDEPSTHGTQGTHDDLPDAFANAASALPAHHVTEAGPKQAEADVSAAH